MQNYLIKKLFSSILYWTGSIIYSSGILGILIINANISNQLGLAFLFICLIFVGFMTFIFGWYKKPKTMYVEKDFIKFINQDLGFISKKPDPYDPDYEIYKLGEYLFWLKKGTLPENVAQVSIRASNDASGFRLSTTGNLITK